MSAKEDANSAKKAKTEVDIKAMTNKEYLDQVTFVPNYFVGGGGKEDIQRYFIIILCFSAKS